MPRVPMSEERRMYNSLKRLFMGMINDVRNGYIQKADIQDKAREFLESEEVDAYLRHLMTRMTARFRIDSAKELKKKSTTAGTNSRLLFELMKHEMEGPVGRRIYEIIADNVQYIKTIPQEWANYVIHYTQREALKGKRPAEIEAELRKILPEHMTKNLKCVARTECAKANAAICQARAEAVGIRCYFWRCVKDNRVRDSHWDMDGILVFYDDPPSPEALFPYARNKKGDPVKAYGPYHAGNTFNCRCWQEVVVDMSFLPDRFRFYRAGQVQWITKREFIREFS